MNTIPLQNTFRTPEAKPVPVQQNTFKSHDNALLGYDRKFTPEQWKRMVYGLVKLGLAWFMGALGMAGLVSWLVK